MRGNQALRPWRNEVAILALPKLTAPRSGERSQSDFMGLDVVETFLITRDGHDKNADDVVFPWDRDPVTSLRRGADDEGSSFDDFLTALSTYCDNVAHGIAQQIRPATAPTLGCFRDAPMSR